MSRQLSDMSKHLRQGSWLPSALLIALPLFAPAAKTSGALAVIVKEM